jgi:hypothetical protein
MAGTRITKKLCQCKSNEREFQNIRQTDGKYICDTRKRNRRRPSPVSFCLFTCRLLNVPVSNPVTHIVQPSVEWLGDNRKWVGQNVDRNGRDPIFRHCFQHLSEGTQESHEKVSHDNQCPAEIPGGRLLVWGGNVWSNLLAMGDADDELWPREVLGDRSIDAQFVGTFNGSVSISPWMEFNLGPIWCVWKVI